MLYKTWAGERNGGWGRTCALGSLRDKGVCVFVGGQKKKAVSETWRGLETGWGEGKVLGGAA